MLGTIDWHKIAKALTTALLVIFLTFSPIATQISVAARVKGRSTSSEPAKSAAKSSGKLTETAPPSTIQELRQTLDDYKPQVSILSPKQNEILSEESVLVRFQVKDLPVFKEKTLGLGPHLHVLLDNQTYEAVYDLSKPLVFENLQPGTHTIRAFASRPWHESFKNEGAYAQTTFHIFTKTEENRPDPTLPLLTYSRPQGTYGAEPIMLDFYLTNAPLHLIAKEDKQDDIADWRIRCSINGNTFVLDQWQPIYLKGFKSGRNWVQLEFLDENGAPVKNTFNNTARLITYEPGGKDTLSKLVRGELSAAEARSVVDPDYKPEPVPAPTPQPKPSPAAKPTPTPIPVPPVAPSVKVTPSPVPAIKPSPTNGSKPSASPEVKASPKPLPTPLISPSPEVTKTPESIPVPKPTEAPKAVEPQPIETPKAVKTPLLVKPEPTVSPKPVAIPKPLANPTQTIKPETIPNPSVDRTKPSLTEKANELKSEFTSQFNKLRDSSLKAFRDRFRRSSPAESPETAPANQPERKPAPTATPESANLEAVTPKQDATTPSASEFYNRRRDTPVPSSSSSSPVISPAPVEKGEILPPIAPMLSKPAA